MSDLYCEYGGDFIIDQSGDIQEAFSWDEVRQKIERDLFTNPAIDLPNGLQTQAEYIFHPDYGLGLKQYLGQLYKMDVITQMQERTLKQLRQDPAIALSPPPVVAFKFVSIACLQIYINVWLADNTPGHIALEVSE